MRRRRRRKVGVVLKYPAVKVQVDDAKGGVAILSRILARAGNSVEGFGEVVMGKEKMGWTVVVVLVRLAEEERFEMVAEFAGVINGARMAFAYFLKAGAS